MFKVQCHGSDGHNYPRGGAVGRVCGTETEEGRERKLGVYMYTKIYLSSAM